MSSIFKSNQRMAMMIAVLPLLLASSACAKYASMMNSMKMPTIEGTEEEWNANIKKGMRLVKFDDRCTDKGREPYALVVTQPDGYSSEIHQLAHGWWMVGTKAKAGRTGQVVCSVDKSGTAYKDAQICNMPCQ